MKIGNILIVDDEQANLDALRDTLEDVNYLVLSANNAENAKKIIKNNNIDLILLDVWMARQDGISLLQELRNENIAIPIIMMSGHAEHSDVVSAMQLGANDFIKKPISNILSLVRDTLNNSTIKTNANEFNLPFKQARSEFEKKYFYHHLSANNNNISKVAIVTKIERTTLYRKLKDLGIDKL